MMILISSHTHTQYTDSLHSKCIIFCVLLNGKKIRWLNLESVFDDDDDDNDCGDVGGGVGGCCK